MAWSFTQYQIKTEAPPSAFPPIPTFTSWFQALSEPVRQKPGLKSYLHPFETQAARFIPDSSTLIEGWFQALSEPVRTKPAVRAGDQPFFSFEPEPPESMEIEWFAPLSEPVIHNLGLRAANQQFLAQPPRILPTPNVTVRMSATELNSDVAQLAINVYTGGNTTIPGAGAQVSIEEIPIPGNSPVSNKGN